MFALVGSTASGKTEVALRVAERAEAELISMDSMLVYRGLDVGTAKPSAAQRARVPHHLIDVADPAQRYSVQRWLAGAEQALAEIAARGRRALFVGGTALYLKALCNGLFEGPATDLRLRAEIEARADRDGLESLSTELERLDPESARRIHPNDRKRLVRAIETWEQTGKTLSEWQAQWSSEAQRPRRLVGLRVEPDELERRIVARTRAMLAGGWGAELRELGGLEALGATARQALGYAEIAEHLDGQLDDEACLQRIALRTRQFARRQRTWFRSFADIRWVPGPGSEADVERAAGEVVRALGWEL